MGKNKLKKFSEMQQMTHVLQYPFATLKEKGFDMRGHWHEQFFQNDNPIVLELGCGKGEYAVGLARRFPDKNFIGIDIKGARMHTGASQAEREHLPNVGFLRTSIELLPEFFEKGEVAEIWITFPDPQMKKARKRLTSTRFLELYRNVTSDGAEIHLKTDSPFLYQYTRRLVNENRLPVVIDTDNLYANPGLVTDILDIRTHYEQQWLSRGLTIKYLSFRLPAQPELTEPQADDIPPDTYRSYSRGYLETHPIQTEN